MPHGAVARGVTLLSDPYRRRWLGWGFLVGAFFLVSLHRVSTAVLSGELQAAFDTTGASLGLLHSSFFVLYALMQVPAGLLTDRYGARAIAAGGTGLMSLGAIAFGFAPNYVVAFLGRLMVGFGASVLFVAVLRFCANWFRPDEFGTMTGVTFSVGILGGLAATTPLALAIEALGWRGSMAGLGLLGLIVALGIVLLSHDSPTDADLQPIDNVPDRPEVTATDLKRYVTQAASEVETWLLGIMLFFMTGVGITIFGLWGIPFLVQTYDLSVVEASIYLAIGNVGGMIGPTLFGWLSDRLGKRTELIALSAAVFALTWAIFAVFGAIPLLLVAAIFLFGRILRGGIPLAFTTIKERHPEGASGTVIGLINTMGWIGAIVFPVVLGWALDVYWTGETVNGQRVYTLFGYRVAFAIAVGAGVIALACGIALHRRTRGDRPMQSGPDVSPTD
jgi:sugar phosphate permease